MTALRRNTQHLAAIFGLASIVGCPSTVTGPLLISEVNVEGASGATQFDLILIGRGFGLSEVTYDIDEASGSATAYDYQVRVLDQFGQVHAVSSGASVTIRSPNEILTTITRTTPLEPGVYGVDISLVGVNGAALAQLTEAFEVSGEAPPDAGFPRMDMGLPGRDAGVVDAAPRPDTGSPDTGVDAGPPDLGMPDTGPPDLGLGPWEGAFQYRRQIAVRNPTNADSPNGVTIRVPVDHQSLVVANQSKPDGADLALYLDGVRLEHQWGDREAVGTDALTLIARLPRQIPPGPLNNPPLLLYFGDPNLEVPRSEGVFAVAERFDANINWRENAWGRDCAGRGNNMRGAYCVDDGGSGNTRRTLASPIQQVLVDTLAPNEVYEWGLWIAGSMQGATDLLYLAYGNSQTNYANTTLFDDVAFVDRPPDASATFDEQGGGQRTARGWRFPPPPGAEWEQTRVRFVPAFSEPSIHVRFVSMDDTSDNDTLVAIDDLTIRRALNPDFEVSEGPIDAR